MYSRYSDTNDTELKVSCDKASQTAVVKDVVMELCMRKGNSAFFFAGLGVTYPP